METSSSELFKFNVVNLAAIPIVQHQPNEVYLFNAFIYSPSMCSHLLKSF